MSKKHINDNKYLYKRKKYKFFKLFGTLLLVTIFTIACSKEATTVSSTPGKSTDHPSADPTPTKKLDNTNAPEPTTTPQATKVPTSGIKDIVKNFKPSDEVAYGKSAIAQGHFVFYRSGKFFETNIVVKNTKTSKEATLVTLKDGQLNPSEMYLLGNNLYYHENDDIYRIDVDGENKVQLFKGTASILGISNDNIIALDKKTKEIIGINNKGDKTVLAKLNSINPIEVVVMEDGIYYVSKKSNNKNNGKDPTDRLYYIDFNGNNKAEIDAEIDIYDLKTNGNDLFYISISDKSEEMRINKVKGETFSTIHTITKEELENLEVHWYQPNTFTLLGVNETHVYYGINTDFFDTLAVYSVKTNGENPQLYLNIKDLPNIDPSAYFSKGMMDDGYLKIILDCDSNPVQIYLIDLKDKSSILFQGGYYNSNTIDVLGDTIYYCKANEFDPFMDDLENWEYGYSKISESK